MAYAFNDDKTKVDLESYVKQLILSSHPVGSIHISTNDVNPSNYLGGTWVAWGSGRVPVGVDANDTNFNTVEKTGGEKTHTLTVDEIPSHHHKQKGLKGEVAIDVPNTGGSAYGFSSVQSAPNTDDTGGGNAHNNLQPYITCYMWKRTA